MEIDNNDSKNILLNNFSTRPTSPRNHLPPLNLGGKIININDLGMSDDEDDDKDLTFITNNPNISDINYDQTTRTKFSDKIDTIKNLPKSPQRLQSSISSFFEQKNEKEKLNYDNISVTIEDDKEKLDYISVKKEQNKPIIKEEPVLTFLRENSGEQPKRQEFPFNNQPKRQEFSFNNQPKRNETFFNNPIKGDSSFNNPLKNEQTFNNPLKNEQTFNNPLKGEVSYNNPSRGESLFNNQPKRTELPYNNPINKGESSNNSFKESSEPSRREVINEDNEKVIYVEPKNFSEEYVRKCRNCKKYIKRENEFIPLPDYKLYTKEKRKEKYEVFYNNILKIKVDYKELNIKMPDYELLQDVSPEMLDGIHRYYEKLLLFIYSNINAHRINIAIGIVLFVIEWCFQYFLNISLAGLHEDYQKHSKLFNRLISDINFGGINNKVEPWSPGFRLFFYSCMFIVIIIIYKLLSRMLGEGIAEGLKNKAFEIVMTNSSESIINGIPEGEIPSPPQKGGTEDVFLSTITTGINIANSFNKQGVPERVKKSFKINNE